MVYSNNQYWRIDMYFKKMVGKKCYLSPINVNDVEKFTEWLNDLELTVNFTSFDKMINVANEKILLEKISVEHNYSIIEKETDELLGNCGFFDIDYLNQTAETGIFIGNKSYWNKGYGTEAITLLIDYGFKALNLHNIMIRVYEFNKRAIRSYEKIGFKRFGVRREALQRELKRHNIIHMDILSNEFYENGKNK